MKRLPTVEEIVENFDAFQQQYKKAKKQVAEKEAIDASRTTMKTIFDTHVVGHQWDPNKVVILAYKERLHNRCSYVYRDEHVSIDYLSRITWCNDDCDTFVDILVKVDDMIMYQEKKDNVIVDVRKKK